MCGNRPAAHRKKVERAYTTTNLRLYKISNVLKLRRLNDVAISRRSTVLNSDKVLQTKSRALVDIMILPTVLPPGESL